MSNEYIIFSYSGNTKCCVPASEYSIIASDSCRFAVAHAMDNNIYYANVQDVDIVGSAAALAFLGIEQ